MWKPILAAAATLFLAAPAQAQNLIPAHKLPLSMAIEAGQAAIDACKGMGWDVTAVIVEPSGLPKAILVSDGAGPPSVEIARRKAYTAAMFGEDTETRTNRQLAQAKARQEAGTPTLPPPPVADASIVSQAGGVPFMVGKEIVGAIGISGAGVGGVDPACARAGVAKIANRLK